MSGARVIVLDSYALLCGDDGLIKKEYSADTLHLNKEGYRVLNKELEGMLETIRKDAPQDTLKHSASEGIGR